jgi:hypothetical protein
MHAYLLPVGNLDRLAILDLDRRSLAALLVQGQVEAADDRVGVVDGNRSYVGQGLDLGGARDRASVLVPSQ